MAGGGEYIGRTSISSTSFLASLVGLETAVMELMMTGAGIFWTY